MRDKMSIYFLLFSLLVVSALLWMHAQRIDMDAEEKEQAAVNVRRDYVISHDFGYIKEQLVENHRDHWQAYIKAERQTRWELGGLALLALLLFILTIREFYWKARSSGKSQ